MQCNTMHIESKSDKWLQFLDYVLSFLSISAFIEVRKTYRKPVACIWLENGVKFHSPWRNYVENLQKQKKDF